MKVLFLGKKNDFYCHQALDYISRHAEVISHLGQWGDKLPEDIGRWEGDWIISYLSRWIIPTELAKRTKKGSLNFHPGPPEYPGIGCTNFAIYDGVDEYGVTCHYLVPKVDTGTIFRVVKFPVFSNDTVYSLTQKAYAHMLVMFYAVADDIINDCFSFHSVAPYGWIGKPYIRKDLNELCKITLDMPDTEIKRRIKATTYPGMPGAYIELGGTKFKIMN